MNKVAAAFLSVLCALCVYAQEKKELPLPTSKMLLTPAPGGPRRTNSLPVTMAVSPDGKYIAVLNNGYGTVEANGQQSIAVLNTATSELTDFPDPRLGLNARQTYFLGLAFSGDSKHLYASVASISDPEGAEKGSLGNGIAVYAFENGRVMPERFIPIPLQTLPKGRKSYKVWSKLPEDKAVPYPAGLAVAYDRRTPEAHDERLVVADNLSDDIIVVDPAAGKILRRVDLSIGERIPAAYPYSVVTSSDGQQAWVSLWNASQIVEIHLQTGAIVRRIDLRKPQSSTVAGSHPTAMLLSEPWLFVTLANTDEIAVVEAWTGKVKRYLSVKLPGQSAQGAYPGALAETRAGYLPSGRGYRRLVFIANASSDAVAVLDIEADGAMFACPDRCYYRYVDMRHRPKLRFAKSVGFIPTEWYPTALAVAGDELFIASGKGQSTGPNHMPLKPGEDARHAHPFIASLLHGSMARVKLSDIDTKAKLKPLTEEVLRSNLMLGKGGKIPFASGRNPIKHVIYVIKENRTYDQVFGDLPGDGDPSLVLYGEDVTPNQHRLARQFGIIDNFYDSGEVSGDGHVWSTAAITSDYTEKTWQIGYRSRERTYDYEGRVANGMPLDDDIPDVNEPGTGYLWTNLARHRRSYRHYGEYVSTRWCTTAVRGDQCARAVINPGEPLADGKPSPYHWPIPVLAENRATKPELRGHFDPNYADFRTDYPDQLRADEFLREFAGFVKHKNLPQFITLRLPADHTAGTQRKHPRPAAAVADNDLALGRVVEAVSHSPYWDSTAIFVLEDDAQNGADHVDAHRSMALVISQYAPRAGSDVPTTAAPMGGTSASSVTTSGPGATGPPTTQPEPLVDHHFYTTVNMIHTMETLLVLPPMNHNDGRAALMAPLFSGDGTQPAFTADYRNRDNGLIYEANPDRPATAAQARDAAASEQLDFSHADAADAAVLNAILWRDRKGEVSMPAPVHTMCGKSE